MTECINLQERFGQKYKITFDSAAQSKRDVWQMQIPCKFGTVYPFGGDRLSVEVDYHPKAAQALAGLHGVRLQQDGELEKTFVFPVALFDRVAEIVKPRRKRRLTPEQRERLAAYAFQKPPCLNTNGTERKATPTESN